MRLASLKEGSHYIFIIDQHCMTYIISKLSRMLGGDLHAMTCFFFNTYFRVLEIRQEKMLLCSRLPKHQCTQLS